MTKQEVESYLARQETILLRDGNCGEPVVWGKVLIREVSSSVWADFCKSALRYYKKVICIAPGRWGVVTKELTPQQAVKQYGKATNIEVGPRGGYCSVTFGRTKFTSQRLDIRSGNKQLLSPNCTINVK